ncbi:MAG: hypothetical protein M3N97_05835 [Pseudomonadota bacterium]|nr:hypothetical protein [Pseudomonadota bacterium]
MIYTKCMRVIVSAIAVLPFCCAAATTKAPDNLTGVWERDYVASNFLPQTDNKSTDKVFTLGDGTVIPLRPEAEKVYRQRVAMAETAQVFANTSSRCLPLGTPQNMMGAPPYPIRIVQTDDFIAILLEEGWEFRAIYMGGTHPQEMVPSFMGHSVGRWEGKTLVIDTVGLRTETTLNYTGLPHSEQLRLVERMRRTAPNVLEDLIEVHDPVMYSKPFTFKAVFNRIKEQQIEYICEDSRIEVTPDGRQSYHAP